jgi:hypothetical protein
MTKRELLIFGIPALIGLLLCGCATLGQLTASRIEAIAKLASYTACITSAGDITSESRANWTRTLGALRVMESDENWDAATLGIALSKAELPAMVGTEGQLIISTGVALLDLFTGSIYTISQDEQVRAVVRGAAAGIDLALNDALVSHANARIISRGEEIRIKLEQEARATRPRK